MANIPNNNGRVGIMGISYDAEDAALLKRRHTGRVDRADHLFGAAIRYPGFFSAAGSTNTHYPLQVLCSFHIPE